MAEAVALVASVIAIIQISDRVIELAKYYIESSSDAPSELRTILVEISTFGAILKSLEYLHKCDLVTPALWNQIRSPIEECRQVITDLEKLFPSDSVDIPTPSGSTKSSKKRKVKAVVAALAWPLKASRARQLLQRIAQYKAVLSLALTTESVQDIKAIKTKIEDIHTIVTDRERYEVYKWLQATDPSPLHNRAWKDYEPGTGAWMLRSPDWAKWLTGTHRCLWIHGIPGAGKTILASFLIEQVKIHCKHTPDKSLGQAYYYCYFGHNQDEASPFLRWIISQLYRQAAFLPAQIYNIYKAGIEPSQVELLDALELVLDKFVTAYIVIDALDESSPRMDLLKIIRDISTDMRFSKIKILVTSREYIDIERVMEGISITTSMSNPFVQEDIRTHIHSLLTSGPKFQRWPKDLLTETEDTISKGAKGMFRWAVCQLDVLQRLKCDKFIIQVALRTLPRTLDETYERIFLSISREEWCALRHVLHWMWFHNKLFIQAVSCTILSDAIQYMLKIENSPAADIDYSLEHVRELCGCLLHISDSTEVTFSHYTVLEYIKSERILNGEAGYFAVLPKEIVLYYTRSIILRAQSGLISWVVPPVDELCYSNGDPWKDRPAYHWFDNDFTFYCASAALVSIPEFAEELASHDRLMSLITGFLNPTSDHFAHLSELAYEGPQVTFLEGITHCQISEINLFIKLDAWNEIPSETEAAAFLNLIMISQAPSLVLFERFLSGGGKKVLLNTKLMFQRNIQSVTSGEDNNEYHFDGTLLEIVFQITYMYATEPLLNLLLDYSEGLFDPSRILISFIGSHWAYEENGACSTTCVLRRLLVSGANPNLEDFRITPLQIAVVSCDYMAVKLLLESGAHPNYTGNPSGMLWQAKHILGRFNHLDGVSPLYICRKFDCIPSWGMRDKDKHEKREREKIEQLLISYGAEDL